MKQYLVILKGSDASTQYNHLKSWFSSCGRELHPTGSSISLYTYEWFHDKERIDNDSYNFRNCCNYSPCNDQLAIFCFITIFENRVGLVCCKKMEKGKMASYFSKNQSQPAFVNIMHEQKTIESLERITNAESGIETVLGITMRKGKTLLDD